MLSLQHLKGRIAAYASGEISLGEFQDWLDEESVDPIPVDLEDLVFSVESALSARHFGGLNQQGLRAKLQELATAARPLSEVVVTLSLKARSLSPVPVPAMYRVYIDGSGFLDARVALGSSMRVERMLPSGDVVGKPRTASAIAPVLRVCAVS